MYINNVVPVMIETKFKMLVMNLAYWSDIDAHQVTK
jgi:hypothetical protein